MAIKQKKIHAARRVRTKGSVKCAVEVSRNRLLFVSVLIALCFSSVALRLLDLSVARDGGIRKHVAAIEGDKLKIERSAIVDRNGILLATNLKTASLYANSKVVLDAREAAKELQKVFPEMSFDKTYKKLSSEKGFVWLKRNLHPEEQYAVNNLGIPGLYFQEEEKRVYPHGSLVSHILGFVGVDGHGLSGVEKRFDKKLLSDALYKVSDKEQDLQLSIDVRVQDILHKALAKQFEAHKAKSGAGVVMDVNTGEVLAMVSLPDFDPNIPSKIKQSNAFNTVTKGLYEMGSTFKAFTMAMALDSGVTAIDDSYDARKPIKISRFNIRDHHAKKRFLSVPEIFMYSSNIGAAKMADDVGGEYQRAFLTKLGLLDEMDLEVPETSSPLYPDRWGRLSTMTISYGHGVAVSPLHVAAATASLINGGVYNSPTLVSGGNEGKDGVRVIKDETSDLMKKLFRLVVDKGTGRKAGVKGYVVGGKTGTAEKPGIKKYDKKRMVSSFVGAFPMNKPKYVVLAVFDEPKGNKETFGYATGGFTAAPVVKDVIAQMGPLLGMSPVDENSPEVKTALHIDYELNKIKGWKKLASVGTH